jgi:plastocyanin
MRFRLVVAGSAVLALGLALFPALALAEGRSPVSIVDKSFDPVNVTITMGDTVVWTVTKAIAEPHSVTSGVQGDPNSGKDFDSGIKLKNNGDTFEHTFNTAGVFPYYCVVHPTEMKGTVTVLAPGGAGEPGGASPPGGSVSPEGSAGPQGSAGPEGSPGASAGPGADVEPRPPVSTGDKVIAGGILAATLVVLFGAAWFYRRVNG